MTNHLTSIALGVRRRWRPAIVTSFATVGAIWTITEMLAAIFSGVKLVLDSDGFNYLILVLIIFVITFISYSYEPMRVEFKVPGCDTKIKLEFGDLFNQQSHILVGVNEFFDGELGQPVSKNTVHGQFIVRNFSGSAVEFRKIVDLKLSELNITPTQTARAFEPSKSFPLGTTIAVPNGQHLAFLMAMAKTDLVNSKATSDVPMLWSALETALKTVHFHGNGGSLAMPLFGNGQSGIKLEPQHLLRLIVLNLINFSINGNARLPKKVLIILHEDCFQELDIREIARDWKV